MSFIIPLFKKLPHFGHFKQQRDSILSSLFKQGNPPDCSFLHHDGKPLGYSVKETGSNPRTLKLDDVIGRALDRVGPYKRLDNTEQVVALIDDVSCRL